MLWCPTMAERVNTWLTTPLPEVECACIRCGRRFGPYMLEPQNDRSITLIEPAGRPSVVPGYYWEPRYGSTRRRKGPRTGTGLQVETFSDRPYLRVVCKCGRNENLGRRKLDEMMFDDEGNVRLRDDVLYV